VGGRLQIGAGEDADLTKAWKPLQMPMTGRPAATKVRTSSAKKARRSSEQAPGAKRIGVRETAGQDEYAVVGQAARAAAQLVDVHDFRLAAGECEGISRIRSRVPEAWDEDGRFAHLRSLRIAIIVSPAAYTTTTIFHRRYKRYAK
jgi:hypothetical protein